VIHRLTMTRVVATHRLLDADQSVSLSPWQVARGN
jgi:hypothetical protein